MPVLLSAALCWLSGLHSTLAGRQAVFPLQCGGPYAPHIRVALHSSHWGGLTPCTYEQFLFLRSFSGQDGNLGL